MNVERICCSHSVAANVRQLLVLYTLAARGCCFGIESQNQSNLVAHLHSVVLISGVLSRHSSTTSIRFRHGLLLLLEGSLSITAAALVISADMCSDLD